MSWAWTIFLSIVGSILGSAVLSTLISGWQATRLRKQELFAKAYQVALRRVEMLYRILRRTGDLDEDVRLRDAMHEVQEDTSYYAGLLTIESKKLGDSYAALINKIRLETADSFRDAWKNNPKKPSAELKNFKHPKYADEEKAYLAEARNNTHLIRMLRNGLRSSSSEESGDE